MFATLRSDILRSTGREPAAHAGRCQPLWTCPQQPQTFFERRSSCTIRASGSPKHPARSHSRESPRRQPVHHHLTQIVRGSLCSCTTLAGKSAVCSLLSRLSRGRAIHSRMTFLRVSYIFIWAFLCSGRLQIATARQLFAETGTLRTLFSGFSSLICAKIIASCTFVCSVNPTKGKRTLGDMRPSKLRAYFSGTGPSPETAPMSGPRSERTAVAPSPCAPA